MGLEVFLIVCFFVLFGILLVWLYQKYKKHEPIMAECVDIIVRRNRRTRSYCAVFEYKYDGREYEFKEKCGTIRNKRKVGEMYKIYVNKDKPWKCLTAQENGGIILIVIFLVDILRQFLFEIG